MKGFFLRIAKPPRKPAWMKLSGSLVFAASFCEEWKRALKALSFRQLPLCECPNRNFIDLFYLMTFLRLQCLLSTRVSDSARVYISSAQQ